MSALPSIGWPFRGREVPLRRGVGALRRGGGCVVLGAAYVGRTRMLHELVDHAFPSAGPTIVRFRGTPELQDVSYGALAGQAPNDDDAAAWIRRLRTVEEPVVIVVDDAQDLDGRTAALLLHVARGGHARLALSVRTPADTSPALVTLWKDELLEAVTIDRLTRATCDDLVSDALSGRVQRPLLQELWDLSRGYPMILRELLLGGLEEGAIVELAGGWSMVSPLRASARLAETVRVHAARFPDDVREALHLIALGEPLEPRVVDQLVPVGVRPLERRGLVTVDPADGRYRVAAPGICMAVRRYLLPSELRRLSRLLLDHVGDGVQVASMRRARWAIDAGVEPPSELLVTAAERALEAFDHEQAESFARAAAEGGVRAQLCLAQALVGQGRANEARAALEAAAAAADDDVSRAEVALTHGQVLFFHLGMHDEAMKLLQRLVDEIHHEEPQGAVLARLAIYQALVGSPRRAIATCEPLWAGGQPDAVRLRAIVSATWPLMMIGQVDDVLALTERGTALARRVGSLPVDIPLLEMTATIAELWCGRIAQAVNRAGDRYNRTLSRNAEGLQGSWAAHLACAQLFAGRLEEAAVAADEASQLLEVADPFDLRPGAYAHVAMIAACRGDTATAGTAHERMRRASRGTDHRHRHVGARVEVMVAAARGALEAAASAAVARGREAVELEHLTMGALTIYQAVRFGYPERARPLLEELCRAIDGDLVRAWWHHAEALAAGDAAGLESAAERLLSMDAMLWGAEAYAQAAGLYAAQGRPALAASARARAGALRDRTGARTPALRGVEHEQALTRREREVSLLAAEGMTSREIGQRLHVSVRTVDNHLASVYRKLGLAGRQDLARALAVDVEPRS